MAGIYGKFFDKYPDWASFEHHPWTGTMTRSDTGLRTKETSGAQRRCDEMQGQKRVMMIDGTAVGTPRGAGSPSKPAQVFAVRVG